MNKEEKENKEVNIVKKVCAELGVNQRELAEMLGSHLTTVQKWSSSDDIPKMALKSIELLVENNYLKSKVNKIETILKLIDELKN